MYLHYYKNDEQAPWQLQIDHHTARILQYPICNVESHTCTNAKIALHFNT